MIIFFQSCIINSAVSAPARLKLIGLINMRESDETVFPGINAEVVMSRKRTECDGGMEDAEVRLDDWNVYGWTCHRQRGI